MNADELLDDLANGEPAVPAGRDPQRLQKVRYTHDAMIDLIVADPAISQGALATTFGYTQTWVSLVMSSDAFKERLEARRGELVDPVIRASIRERFEALTRRSLEVLQEKLSQPASAVSDNLALRAAELGAKALGVGGNAPPIVVPQPDRLDRLAERLLALRPQPIGAIYEGQVEEIPVG